MQPLVGLVRGMQQGYVVVAWVVPLLCVRLGFELVLPGELLDGMNGIDAEPVVSIYCVDNIYVSLQAS